MRFLNDWRLKYVVLGLTLAAALVLFYWAIENARLSVSAVDRSLYEQRAFAHRRQGVGAMLVGIVLFASLMARDWVMAWKTASGSGTPPFFVWDPFTLATVLTLVVWVAGWHLPAYYPLLTVLGLLSLALGIRVLRRKRGRPSAITLVVAALLIGQLWFIPFAVATPIWSIREFAP